MKIEFKYFGITKNSTYKNNKQNRYIILHDTGNTNKGANAQAHINLLQRGTYKTSANYYTSSYKNKSGTFGQIYQGTPDSRVCWASGGSHHSRLAPFKGIAGDWNGIVIEFCVNSDGDYESNFLMTVELIKNLMKKYNIPKHNVITHGDTAGKNCPATIYAKNDWIRLKKLIAKPIKTQMKLGTDTEYYNLALDGSSTSTLKDKASLKIIQYGSDNDLESVAVLQDSIRNIVLTVSSKVAFDFAPWSNSGYEIIRVGGGNHITSYTDYALIGKDRQDTLNLVKHFILDFYDKKNDLKEYRYKK